jgi:hypothetical protein
MYAQPILKAMALLAKRNTFAALIFSSVLGACGGGGGGDSGGSPVTTTATATSATSSLSQGRWLSSNLTPAYSAIVVPASSGANSPAVDTVWALAQDASRLIKLQINGTALASGTVSGKEYVLGTTTVTAITGGSYSTTNLTQMSLQPLLGTTALFDRTDVMSTALQAAQANGNWTANLGSVVVTWTVQSANTGAAATDNLSGSSTTGCTYSGQSAVVTTQSLYKVQFTETCAGTSQTFKGVATVSADGAHLTVVATNEDETKAAALLFTPKP